MNKQLKYWLHAAMIAAIYAVLTLAFRPISYGMIQVRISEALTVLPFFTTAAIPGLAAGVFIANLMGPYGLTDMVVGTLATTLAALFTSRVKYKKLAPLPPVVFNAIMIELMLYYLFLGTPDQISLWLIIFWVGVGQVIACYGLGYPLLLLLEKYKQRIF